MASGITVVLTEKQPVTTTFQSYCVCESVCETPSQPPVWATTGYRLASPVHAVQSHRDGDPLPPWTSHLPSSLWRPAQHLCPFAVFAVCLYVGNPARAAAEGFLGVPYVAAYTYLKNCSHGSIFLLSPFSEVFTEHLSQGLTRCPPCFTGLQSHSSVCSPFPAVYPV